MRDKSRRNPRSQRPQAGDGQQRDHVLDPVAPVAPPPLRPVLPAPAPPTEVPENPGWRRGTSAAGALTGGGNPQDQPHTPRNSAGEGTGGTSDGRPGFPGTPLPTATALATGAAGRSDADDAPEPIRADPLRALPAPGTATALATGAAGRAGVEGVHAPPHSHNGDGHDEIPKDLKKPDMFRVILVAAVLLVVLGIVFAVGVVPRLTQKHDLAAGVGEAEELPVVNVQHPRRARADTDLVLTASVKAWEDTGIYARITGYVKAWNFNLGDSVKAGDVLAVLDAPDTDQQLAQAKAQLAQNRAALIKAEADLVYNQLQLKRNQDLRAINAVSQQQLDQQVDATSSAQSTVEVTKAMIAQNEANVRLFTQEQQWEQVTAPFSGKVTARNVNLGDLIMPGTSATNTTAGAKEMFHIAETDPLRVMISVPQTFVSFVKLGQPAAVYFRDDARNPVHGTISHFAGALDPTSRTLLTEVDVPNPADALKPGMYMDVKLSVQRNKPPLMVPQSALIFNADGTRVAIIRHDADKTITHFQEITVGRDTGAELEVQTGLSPDDLIVVNPGERLTDGGRVKLGTTAPPPSPRGASELSTFGAQPPATTAPAGG